MASVVAVGCVFVKAQRESALCAREQAADEGDGSRDQGVCQEE